MAKINLLFTGLVILLALCLFSIRCETKTKKLVVQTEYGPVRGRSRQSENGAWVNEFLGIPYAAPPVGDLRFKKTVKPANFTGTYEADKMPPACPQYSEQRLPWYDLEPGQSEDCLYLNIWAPANIWPANNTNWGPRSVKFYVHGDDWFQAGSIRMGYYDGFGEAVDTEDGDGNWQANGIVVVTVNYRLGALGFLSSGMPDNAPGNMGLYDILEAFDWMVNNIDFFGGAATYLLKGFHPAVTLVGQGSGAIAVSLLKTAVKRIGQVPNTVLNGASFLTLKALDGVDEEGDAYVNNLRLTNKLADALGCPTPLRNNRNATIECLKGVEASRLVKAAACLSRGRGPPNVFLPQIRGPDQFFFGSNPYFMIHEYEFLYNEAMVTFTSEEGSHLLTSAFPRVFGEFGKNNVALSAACSKAVARKFLKKFPQKVADRILGDLDPEPTTANRDKVVQAFGDAFFYCPSIYFLEELQRPKIRPKYAPIQAYILEKLVYPPYNPWADWMGSVGFSIAQIDFLHLDGQISVNNQTYAYTDEQSKQARFSNKLLTTFMSWKRDVTIPKFTPEDPAYNVLDSEGNLSDEKNSNFHGRNCDILRPYFRFPGIPSYE